MFIIGCSNENPNENNINPSTDLIPKEIRYYTLNPQGAQTLLYVDYFDPEGRFLKKENTNGFKLVENIFNSQNQLISITNKNDTNTTISKFEFTYTLNQISGLSYTNNNNIVTLYTINYSTNQIVKNNISNNNEDVYDFIGNKLVSLKYSFSDIENIYYDSNSNLIPNNIPLIQYDDKKNPLNWYYNTYFNNYLLISYEINDVDTDFINGFTYSLGSNNRKSDFNGLYGRQLNFSYNALDYPTSAITNHVSEFGSGNSDQTVEFIYW